MSVKPADPAAAPRKPEGAPAKPPVRNAAGKKDVALALQGGGAHGAFTWGVLDRILEDGRLEIEAITGTSAGAMNAVGCSAPGASTIRRDICGSTPSRAMRAPTSSTRSTSIRCGTFSKRRSISHG